MENRNAIKIIMDHREINEDIKKALLSEPDVTFEVGTLETGDYCINDMLLVERKTFSDLVSSIKDGRIFRQAFRLACSTKHILIVLEGTSQDMKSTAMKREAIQGALICLSVKFHIPVLRSISPEESVKLMVSVYKQIANEKVRRKHLPRRPVEYKSSSKLKQQVFILQGLSGIGPAKAKMLLDRFGTLQAIFSASIPDLKEVQTIGEYTAEKIYSIMNDDFQSYERVIDKTGRWKIGRNN